ncbi:MAG: DeoR family transcriptional regulator [Candidatus Marinimicrobia bacterium]|nr:DeoR family transcriptional regulator [Candidatus Neomarinimicrobiota bacterium]
MGRKSDRNTRRKWILNKLQKEGKIRRINIQNQFNIVRDTAHRDLKALIEKDLSVKKAVVEMSGMN